MHSGSHSAMATTPASIPSRISARWKTRNWKMSEQPRRRIRTQASARDATVMSFVLDAPVQQGRSGRFDSSDDAPLPRALFAISGRVRVEVEGATILLQKAPEADWADLKPRIAAAIRKVLDETDTPLGADGCDPDPGSDSDLLRRVEDLLERQVNPSIAAHGGQIIAERVEQ